MYVLAANTGNEALSSMSGAFLTMALFSIIVEIFIFIMYDFRFWGKRVGAQSAFGISFLFFYIGLFGWMLVTGSGTFSVLDQMALFSSVSGDLSPFQRLYFNLFVAPLIEENFFRISLPVFLFLLFKGMFDSLGEIPVLSRGWFQIGLAGVLSSAGFAAFHTNQLGNTPFVWQAFIFASVLSILFLGDLFYNIIGGVTIVPALLVGIHLSNNLMYFGVGEALAVLTGSVFGWVILGLFAFTFIVALNEAYLVVAG